MVIGKLTNQVYYTGQIGVTEVGYSIRWIAMITGAASASLEFPKFLSYGVLVMLVGEAFHLVV